jgi:glycosyltransferase involved in cell wall biosynthesis
VDVTVVIAARNEADNIRECIESVRFAREVLVVEDGSTDDTASIASSAGAAVLHDKFVTIGGQRNFAIGRATSSWVLVVDADERATPELADEIATTIHAARYDAYRVPRRNFFLGGEIRHGGWERDRPVRLFKPSIKYNESRVHERVEVTGEVGELKSMLVHEPYPHLDKWFEKLRTYSRWWAEDRYEKGKRCGVATVIFRPPARFLSMYLIRGGWMDGGRGALLAAMAATSVFAKYAQLWSLGRTDA